MYKYKFKEHFRWIGQDEYLSQGKFNYGQDIDITSSLQDFRLGSRVQCVGKTSDVSSTNNVWSFRGNNFLLSEPTPNTWSVLWIPWPGDGSEATAPDCVSVYSHASGNFRAVTQFREKIYLFQQNHIRVFNSPSVWSGQAWNLDTTLSVNFPSSVIYNYIEARLFFTEWTGTSGQNVLSYIDEYGIVKSNFLGRYFSAIIVGISHVWSNLHVYTADGFQTIIDIASEVVIESIDLGIRVYGVSNYDNNDFVIGETDSWSGLFACSWYQKQLLFKDSMTETIGAYIGIVNQSRKKIEILATDRLAPFQTLNKQVLINKVTNDLMLFDEGAIKPLCSVNNEGVPFSVISGISKRDPSVTQWVTYNTTLVYFFVRKSNTTYIYLKKISDPLDQNVERSRNGYLIENIFNAGEPTRKKEMVECRIRADVPAWTRLKVRCIIDGTMKEVCEIAGGTVNKVHRYQFLEGGYDFSFIYELYNDANQNDANIYNTPKVQEMEITYNLIEE